MSSLGLPALPVLPAGSGRRSCRSMTRSTAVHDRLRPSGQARPIGGRKVDVGAWLRDLGLEPVRAGVPRQRDRRRGPAGADRRRPAGARAPARAAQGRAQGDPRPGRSTGRRRRPRRHRRRRAGHPAGPARGRAAAAHGDVRRPGRLDRALGPPRPRGDARGPARLPERGRGRDRRASRGTSPSSWATACWPTSAGPGRTRTTPSAPCGPGLAIAGAVGRARRRRPGSRSPPGSGSRPALVVVGDLVGEGAAREEAVVGETPNLAARLQALAEPGGVVISDATRRLVGGLFDLEDLGPRTLKGIDAPVRAFAVSGERAVEDRFAAHQSGAPLPLVGRDQELALLLDRWRLAKGGEGQVVLLSGEPGIGKSRIVLALRERLRAEPHTSVRYNCSPFHANSALHPAIEQLARAAGFAPGDDAATRLAKLEALVGPGDGSGRGPPVPGRPARPAAGRAPRPPAAHPAGEEGAHLPGAAGPARGPGAPEPRPAGPRGRALVRPDHARAVRPGGRAHRVAAGAPRRHLPPRVQAALGRPRARHQPRPEPPGAGGGEGDRRPRSPAAGSCRPSCSTPSSRGRTGCRCSSRS